MHHPDSSSDSVSPDSNTPANLWVQRTISELRSGRAVVITARDQSRTLVLAAEHVTQAGLKYFCDQSEAAATVVISNMRAKVLGLSVTTDAKIIHLPLPPQIDVRLILALSDPLLDPPNLTDLDITPDTDKHSAATAAVQLLKRAHLLPTALCLPLATMDDNRFEAWAKTQSFFNVLAEDIFAAECFDAETLVRVSEAPVPLIDAEQTRVFAYRPQGGGLEHLAIVIGNPQQSEKIPLVRIHSQCFTGDILGSLRCDCGDQLRGAIRAIAEDGAGVLLYLAQEGRGIGLVNKLKAYVLQDQGSDTLDANEKLGFEADERIYDPAAFMLKDLKLSKIRLLTNNPRKLSALSEAGINVVDRVAHAFPSNHHNEAYLLTKKVKGGHLL